MTSFINKGQGGRGGVASTPLSSFGGFLVLSCCFWGKKRVFWLLYIALQCFTLLYVALQLVKHLLYIALRPALQCFTTCFTLLYREVLYMGRWPYVSSYRKVGQRFGSLLVLGLHGQGEDGKSLYLVRCEECGRELVRPGNFLTARRVSCGCGRAEGHLSSREWGRSKSRALFPPVHFFRAARYQAKKRGLTWGITEADWERLMGLPCRYCGGPTTGVDRWDNELGYTLGNVVPACARCNVAKAHYSAEEFFEWAARIVERSEL